MAKLGFEELALLELQRAGTKTFRIAARFPPRKKTNFLEHEKTTGASERPA